VGKILFHLLEQRPGHWPCYDSRIVFICLERREKFRAWSSRFQKDSTGSTTLGHVSLGSFLAFPHSALPRFDIPKRVTCFINVKPALGGNFEKRKAQQRGTHETWKAPPQSPCSLHTPTRGTTEEIQRSRKEDLLV
jgi:hypothetical protein